MAILVLPSLLALVPGVCPGYSCDHQHCTVYCISVHRASADALSLLQLVGAVVHAFIDSVYGIERMGWQVVWYN